jgi:phospholipase/carboxylesterase
MDHPPPAPRDVSLDGWTLRIRTAGNVLRPPVYLLLHGWTGDESVMWVFANRLPANYLLIAPRGPYLAVLGGYSWQAETTRRLPELADLASTVDALDGLLTSLQNVPPFSEADFSQVHLMGFSQGAALAYAYSLLRPERVRTIIGLAGFMPGKANEAVASRPLQDRPVFVAHGSQDAIVPVARARQSVELLERAGARVIYCEDDVGHKLGASCFRGMEAFVADHVK